MLIDIHTHPYTNFLIIMINGKEHKAIHSLDEEKGEALAYYLDVNGCAVPDASSSLTGSRMITLKGKIELRIRPGAIVPPETEASMLEEIRQAAREKAGIPEPVKTGPCRCATECEWSSEHYHLEHHPQCPVMHPRPQGILPSLTPGIVLGLEAPAQPSPPDLAYNAMLDSGAARQRFLDDRPYNFFKARCEVRTECAYKFGVEKSGVPYIDHEKPSHYQVGIDLAEGEDETVIQPVLVSRKNLYVVDINDPADVAQFVDDPDVWNAMKDAINRDVAKMCELIDLQAIETRRATHLIGVDPAIGDDHIVMIVGDKSFTGKWAQRFKKIELDQGGDERL